MDTMNRYDRTMATLNAFDRISNELHCATDSSSNSQDHLCLKATWALTTPFLKLEMSKYIYWFQKSNNSVTAKASSAVYFVNR